METFIKRATASLWRSRDKLFARQRTSRLDVPLHKATIMTTTSTSPWLSNGILFRQLFEHKSSTFTYLLADPTTNNAILIDPVIDTIDRDLHLVQELGLNLVIACNTHAHADHVTGTGLIKQRITGCKSLISKQSGALADRYVNGGDVITVGDAVKLEVRATPGHTNGCVTYVCHQLRCAFTGDALLVRGCGRTDFQQGCPEMLYNSVHSQIFSLPDDYRLYPAHDYKGFNQTSVGEEKKFNARLTKSKSEFVDIMKNLNLPYPKQIDTAVPLNMVCGLQDLLKK